MLARVGGGGEGGGGQGGGGEDAFHKLSQSLLPLQGPQRDTMANRCVGFAKHTI